MDAEELLTIAAHELELAETDADRAEAIEDLLTDWYDGWWPGTAVTSPHAPIAAALVRLFSPGRAVTATAPDVWATTTRAGLDFHAFDGSTYAPRTVCGRSTASATSATLTHEGAVSRGLKPCPRCYPAGETR